LIIKELTLKNYRNYKFFRELFHEKFNIFYGKNGQGKTNILESIFLCAAGKSHRTSRDSEMIKNGEDFFSVDLNLLCRAGERNINFSYNRSREKVIRINGNCLNKIGNLMGNLNVVIFSPEDLLIVKHGPSLRRRFMDITLSQIKRSYFFELQQYNRIMAQRNALLKQIKRNNSCMDTLDIWDEKLARSGSVIIYQRNKFIMELSRMVTEKHSGISSGKELLTIKYQPSLDFNDSGSMNADELYIIFKRKLELAREKDIEREYTGYGPHRDDFVYYLNGMELRLYGSQGQQRTAVLATKLAELEIMQAQTGEKPVLLLDDVMSELDAQRQEFLLEKLSDTQTFITCTDKNSVKNRLKIGAAYFCVNDGEIITREIE